MKIIVAAYLSTLLFLYLSTIFISTTGCNEAAKQSPETVSLGNHTKIIAASSRKEEIRKFYGEVLHSKITKQSDRIDIFRMDSFFLGVVYSDSAATANELLKSVWLEIKTDNPDTLKQRIVRFGVKEIKSPGDNEHFIFQAPDGQVYRVIGNKEDMSKYEK